MAVTHHTMLLLDEKGYRLNHDVLFLRVKTDIVATR